MTNLGLVLESPAWLWKISWKTLAACIAGTMLASTIAHAELPVAVPEASASALARMRDGNVHWAAARLLELAIPLFFLFTGFGARLRRMCDSMSGRRWFWTVTLFACTYLVLATLIVLPFDFYVDYVHPHAAGRSDQTLPNWVKGEVAPLAVRLVVASLLIWLPYRLIARRPRRWWLYCALALIPVAFLALVALPVWIDPLTTTYKPLDDRSLDARIEAPPAGPAAGRAGIVSPARERRRLSLFTRSCSAPWRGGSTKDHLSKAFNGWRDPTSVSGSERRLSRRGSPRRVPSF